MSSATNIALNSRTMSGIILISDGIATLSEGDLTCDDINSNSLGTGNITTNNLTCNGELRTNTNGPYSIPISATSATGSLISYGNVSNSGATDFTNYGSTYNLLKQGFYFNNINSTTTLTNLAIIDNTQTYFKSQLTGCTAETPLNTTSVVNKTYVDSNFVDRTNNLTQNINGLKTFTNDTNFTGSLLAKTNLKMNSVGFKTGNAITLTFPLEETIILAPSSGTTTTLQLPTITLNEIGMVFTIIKRGATPFTTTINTSNGIYLSNATSAVYTNTTLLDTTKYLTKLLISGTSSAYWVELTDYSIFDRDQNNLIYARLASPNAFTNTNTFNSFLPTSTLTPSSGTQLITKDYVDNNFVDRTNNLTQNINGLKTFTDITTFTSGLKTDSILVNNNNINFGICLANTNTSIRVGNASNSLTIETPRITLKPSSNTYSSDIEQSGINFFIKNNNLNGTLDFRVSTNAVVLLLDAINTTISNNLISNSQATFNNSTPICSVATPTANNHLTRKDYVDINFVDKTTDQTITGTKRLSNFFCTALNITPNSGGSGNRQQIYMTGTELAFVPQFNNNNYVFYCNDSVPNLTTPLTINSTNTTIENILISNSQATFNNICPISNTNATLTNHLTTLGFNNNKYIDFITDQTITGTKRLSNFFCTALNITPNSGGSGNRQQIYMTGTELAFVPQFNNNNYAFYCKDSVPTQTKPLNINSVSTTISNLLVSNNITGPSTTGTNNIYTNLISGGIINIGSTSSSCNFDSIPTFNSDATFVGNIFSETAVYFKDIGIGSQLNQARIFKQDDYLYFDTNINYTNGYSFRTSSNDTLTITSALTTINNGLTSNAQSTFNNFTPICSVASPTANNHLVRKDYCDNNFMNLTTGQTKSGTVNFLNQITFNGGSGGGTAINCNNGLNANTVLNVAGQANFNGGAVFNTTLPTTTISATTANQLVNYTTLTSQGFITSSSILSANNNFTGFNTFQNATTFKASLELLDGTGTKSGSVGMLPSGNLGINTNVPSGKIIFGSDDAGGANYTRATIDENEFNFEVPITLNVNYTYYNPVNFTSTRLGYSTSNTGSTNTLTNNVANNSGQIYINAGSWNITYTGTITVITNAITTLTSLEIYVADDLTNDLNIIGINVINYYKISTVPVGQKMRISGSGNYISYVNTSTELNLRLLPLFTAGTGGLNFQGKISATRNA